MSGPLATDPAPTRDASIARFQQQLMRWGKTNYRDFPWRATGDPYAILVSELMLRRTQARQVAPVFERFIARFSRVEVLATADPAEVEAMVLPLGLAWRTPVFQQVARELVDEWGGE